MINMCNLYWVSPFLAVPVRLLLLLQLLLIGHYRKSCYLTYWTLWSPTIGLPITHLWRWTQQMDDQPVVYGIIPQVADLLRFLTTSIIIAWYIHHTITHDMYICTYVHACITLHYTTLPYLTLHYIALYYTTLPYLTLPCITLHCITLHYTTLPYLALHYITLHYLTFPCLALHYTTLHYTTLPYLALHYTTLPYLALHYIHIRIHIYIFDHICRVCTLAAIIFDHNDI